MNESSRRSAPQHLSNQSLQTLLSHRLGRSQGFSHVYINKTNNDSSRVYPSSIPAPCLLCAICPPNKDVVGSLGYHCTQGILFFFCWALSYLPATADACDLYHFVLWAIQPGRPQCCSQWVPSSRPGRVSCELAPLFRTYKRESFAQASPLPSVLEGQDCSCAS